MIFQRERFHDVIDEAMPKLMLHYDEVGLDKDIPLEPMWDKYHEAEASGYLRVFTARLNDYRLIGYNCFFVTPCFHHKSSIQARQDVIYIDKEQRGFGRSFIDWCDHQLAKEKVQKVHAVVKAAHNFGSMLESLSYKLCEHVYVRRLDL